MDIYVGVLVGSIYGHESDSKLNRQKSIFSRFHIFSTPEAHTEVTQPLPRSLPIYYTLVPEVAFQFCYRSLYVNRSRKRGLFPQKSDCELDLSAVSAKSVVHAHENRLTC